MMKRSCGNLRRDRKSLRSNTMRLVLSVLVMIGMMLLGRSAHADDPPKKTISINFDSTATITLSCGATVDATVSTLTAVQQAAVIANIQADFDRAGR